MTEQSAPISTAEYWAIQATAMTEDQLQKCIIALAKRLGWIVYHTYISRGSTAGYPDLHLVHAGRKLSIFAELKTQRGKVTDAQQVWLGALTRTGTTCYVWRPIDWFDQTIAGILYPNEDEIR